MPPERAQGACRAQHGAGIWPWLLATAQRTAWHSGRPLTSGLARLSAALGLILARSACQSLTTCMGPAMRASTRMGAAHGTCRAQRAERIVLRASLGAVFSRCPTRSCRKTPLQGRAAQLGPSSWEHRPRCRAHSATCQVPQTPAHTYLGHAGGRVGAGKEGGLGQASAGDEQVDALIQPAQQELADERNVLLAARLCKQPSVGE